MATVIAFALVTFDQPELFDRLYILIILTIAAVSAIKQQIDIAGISLIILNERLLEELAFLTLFTHYQKLVIYPLILYWIVKYKDDILVKRLIGPLTIITIIAECYWWYTNYPSPQIQYYIALIAINMLTRYLIAFRVTLTRVYAKKTTESLHLDLQIFKLALWFIIVITFMQIEFLIRHLTPLEPMFIYQSYEYIMHSLSVLSLYFIGNHYLKNKSFIKA